MRYFICRLEYIKLILSKFIYCSLHPISIGISKNFFNDNWHVVWFHVSIKMFKWWLPSSSYNNFIWNNKIIILYVAYICAPQLPYYLDLVDWPDFMAWHGTVFVFIWVCVHNHYAFVHSTFTGIKIEGDGCVIIKFTVDLPYIYVCMCV